MTIIKALIGRTYSIIDEDILVNTLPDAPRPPEGRITRSKAKTVQTEYNAFVQRLILTVCSYGQDPILLGTHQGPTIQLSEKSTICPKTRQKVSEGFCPRILPEPDAECPRNLLKVSEEFCPRILPEPDAECPRNLLKLSEEFCPKILPEPDTECPRNLPDASEEFCPRILPEPIINCPRNLSEVSEKILRTPPRKLSDKQDPTCPRMRTKLSEEILGYSEEPRHPRSTSGVSDKAETGLSEGTSSPRPLHSFSHKAGFIPQGFPDLVVFNEAMEPAKARGPRRAIFPNESQQEATAAQPTHAFIEPGRPRQGSWELLQSLGLSISVRADCPE